MSSTANLLKKGPASRIIISDDEEENPIDLLNVPTTSKSNFVKNKSYDQPISKKTKEKEVIFFFYYINYNTFRMLLKSCLLELYFYL